MTEGDIPRPGDLSHENALLKCRFCGARPSQDEGGVPLLCPECFLRYVPETLRDYARRLQGRPFVELVIFHYKRQPPAQVLSALDGTTSELPAPAQELVQDWVNYFGARFSGLGLWRTDCARVFASVSFLANERLTNAGLKPSDEDLVNFFHLAVLNYALIFHQQPKLRRLIREATSKRTGCTAFVLLSILGVVFLSSWISW